MNEFRKQKYSSLYSAAKDAPEGSIIEMGAYHGLGAIALWTGCKDNPKVKFTKPVVTIDSYIDRIGWAGEEYSGLDLAVCMDNIHKMKANVCVVIAEFAEAVSIIDHEKVSVIFWDGGSYEVEKDVASIVPNVVSGGFLLLNDTKNGSLNVFEYARTLNKFGFSSAIRLPSGMIMVEKL